MSACVSETDSQQGISLMTLQIWSTLLADALYMHNGSTNKMIRISKMEKKRASIYYDHNSQSFESAK